MKKTTFIIILTILFYQKICSANIYTRIEMVVNYILNLPGLHEFYSNSLVITPNGEIFCVYSADEPPNIDHGLTHISLFLAKFDSSGNVIFNRLKLVEWINFGECSGCYIKDSYLIILAGIQDAGGAIINIYDLNKDKLKLLKIDNIIFEDVSGAFDVEGNFNISVFNGQRYIKLEKEKDGFKIGINKIFSINEIKSQSVIFSDNEKYSTSSYPVTIVYKNKLVNIYYADSFVKGCSIYRKGEDGFINNYDKIGFQILNLDNYTYEDTKIYDIDKIAYEKVEDVEFLDPKIYQPDPNQIPEILTGGKYNGKDYLYRIKLDENLNPIKHSVQKSNKIKKIKKTDLFPNNLLWYFSVEPVWVNKVYDRTKRKYKFVGYDSEGDNYYYFQKD